MAGKFHSGGVVPPNEPVRLFDLPNEYRIPRETYERLQRLPHSHLQQIAKSFGVSEDMLRDDFSRSSHSQINLQHIAYEQRIHGRDTRMPVILWPWRTREPRSGDMQQMLADIDQVELTPASRHLRFSERCAQLLKDVSSASDRARSKVMLNQMYGTFAP